MVKKSPFQLRHRFASLVVVAAAAVTTACADGPPVPDARQSEQSTPTTATKVPLEVVLVMGTVMAGAEPGCLLLDTGVRRYHLVGGAEAALEPGQEVTITGTADPNTTSTCEQTTPLTVEKIDPAD
jgi:hypothetical protein